MADLVKHIHSEEDLRDFAATHLDYEVRMLVEYCDYLQCHIGEAGPHVGGVLEAFLVHARTIDDFLRMGQRSISWSGNTRVEKDDVLAKDYAPAWTPQSYLDPDLRQRVNRQLMHLSARRDSGFDWDEPAMVRQLGGGFVSFTAGLSATWAPVFDKPRLKFVEYLSR